MKKIFKFVSIIMCIGLLSGCGGNGAGGGSSVASGSSKDLAGLKYTDSVEFKYATMVTIDNFEGG